MGFFKNAFKNALKKQITESQKKAANDRARKQKQETLAEREKREKQAVANKIREHAKLQSQQLLKIVNDCVELVNTTIKPDVFFPRYNLMLEHLESLAGLECTGIFENYKELPSTAFLRIESQFTNETNKFLDRSFEKAKEHAETLKTDNGKMNAVKRYFDNMEKYTVYMSGESLEYFEKMKAANTK